MALPAPADPETAACKPDLTPSPGMTPDREMMVMTNGIAYSFRFSSLLPTAQDTDATVRARKLRNCGFARAAMAQHFSAASSAPISDADLASLTTAYMVCRAVRDGVQAIAIATLSIPGGAQRARDPASAQCTIDPVSGVVLTRALRVSSATVTVTVTVIVDDAGNAISAATGWVDLPTGWHLGFLYDPSKFTPLPAVFTVGQTFTAPNFDLVARKGFDDVSGRYGIFCHLTALEVLAWSLSFVTLANPPAAPDPAAWGSCTGPTCRTQSSRHCRRSRPWAA